MANARVLSLFLALCSLPSGQTALSQEMLDAAEETFDVDTAIAFAALSKLAYCGPGPIQVVPYGDPEELPDLVSVACGDFCMRAGFEVTNIALVTANFFGQKNAEFVYVSRLSSMDPSDPPPADCLLTFRGTWVQPSNFVTDTTISLVDFTTPRCTTGCQVASGPYAMYKRLEPGFLKALKKLGCDEGSRVTATGHSLGGQVAAIAMFFLKDKHKFKVPLSYTFEAPKAFNSKAVRVFEKMFRRPISFFAITHKNDEVPTYPSSAVYAWTGFQVWFTGDYLSDHRFCGNYLDAPKACIHSLLPNQLCSLFSKDPACGGTAPLSGPHCRNPLAPAQSLCNMAGNSPALFSALSTVTCIHGKPLSNYSVWPTVPPGSFVADAPPTMLPTLAPEATASPVRLPSQTPLPGSSCFKEDAVANPVGMLGHFTTTESDPESCQQRCKMTAYCEFFTYNAITGACDLTGGWGAYTLGLMGAIAGPKDCNVSPPTLGTKAAWALQKEYLEYMSQVYIPGCNMKGMKYDENMPDFLPQGFSLAQVGCFGLAMLVCGAASTLLAVRSGVFTRRNRVLPGSLVDALAEEEGRCLSAHAMSNPSTSSSTGFEGI